MNLRRIFAAALVRRVAFIAVALVSAFLVQCFNTANAQACPPLTSERQIAAGIGLTYTTKEQARQACESTGSPAMTGASAGWHDRFETAGCVADEQNKRFVLEWNHIGVWSSCAVYYGDVQASKNMQATGWKYEVEALCSFDDPPLPSGHVQCTGSDFSTCPYTVCSGGCGYDQPGGGLDGYVIDGTRWVVTTGWMPRGQDCTVGAATPGLGTPPSDSDGDGTSDGNDGSPNNPGSDGSGNNQDESKSCGGPGQPECEDDGSNAGSGKGNSSGGGGDCSSPPVSSGDAILAQIAFQTWATRCAIAGNANEGSQGGTGVGPGTGDGAKEGTLKGIKDWLDGNGEGVPDADDPWMDGLPGEQSDWNLGLGGGSCPAPISTTISLGGTSVPIEFSFQPMCDLAGLLNTLFKALGALIAAYIIAGVRR